MSFDVEGYYERYGPMVLRRCRALLRDDAQAQDAMQDVFVALLRHHDRLTDEAPAALLLRVATNTCLNRLRAVRTRAEHAHGDARNDQDEDQDEDQNKIDRQLLRIAGTANVESEGRTVARDLLAKLFRADDPLAASSQTIAVMHLLDGMTLEEVARDAGMSVSGVRKRLRSVRARLAALEGVTP